MGKTNTNTDKIVPYSDVPLIKLEQSQFRTEKAKNYTFF